MQFPQSGITLPKRYAEYTERWYVRVSGAVVCPTRASGELVCSIATAGLIRSMLSGINRWDVRILLVVTGVLAVSAVFAAYLPVRRAALLNPVEALRAD